MPKPNPTMLHLSNSRETRKQAARQGFASASPNAKPSARAAGGEHDGKQHRAAAIMNTAFLSATA